MMTGSPGIGVVALITGWWRGFDNLDRPRSAIWIGLGRRDTDHIVYQSRPIEVWHRT
jgi:hypothetical protein